MIRLVLFTLVTCLFAAAAFGQSLGNAGTIDGTVLDPSGAAVPKAKVTLHNPVTGYNQSTFSAPDGSFHLAQHSPQSVPSGSQGAGIQHFLAGNRDSKLTSGAAQGNARAGGIHYDGDRRRRGGGAGSGSVGPRRCRPNGLLKLPLSDPGGGLSQAITYSTGGVAADGNGFFHPLGDHAQVSFVIDGQPISDQQSKVFSTQLPASAIQSMEVTTGTPDAEFGDKTSLVAQITTRSGLGAGRVFGNIDATYGSFGTAGGSFGLGFGTAKFGNFLAVDGVRSGRFLDTPEFHAIPRHRQQPDDFRSHRLSAQRQGCVSSQPVRGAKLDSDSESTTIRLAQDQRQRVLTWSIAPGYQHTFNSHTLLTINPYIRKDQFNYYASRDPFDRHARDAEPKAAASELGRARPTFRPRRAATTLKYGVDLKQTRLLENFRFGITDPTSTLRASMRRSFRGDPALTSRAVRGAGFDRTPRRIRTRRAVLAGAASVRSDRGGNCSTSTPPPISISTRSTRRMRSLPAISCSTSDSASIITMAWFRKPDRSRAWASPTTSRRPERFCAPLTRERSKRRSTRIFCSRARPGSAAWRRMCSARLPCRSQPGFRNQFNTGFQQAIGKFLLIDADYFWKYTHNAYDFSTLLNTTITFPIAWHNSKLDGVTGRVSTTNLQGLPGLLDVRPHARALFLRRRMAG